MDTPIDVNKRLLVVDDNEAIHKDFQKVFSDRGQDEGLKELDQLMFGENETDAVLESCYDLTFASQGKQAYEIVQRELDRGLHFALAFVDMRMPPGWDGVETIKRLWTLDADLHVVICTAYTDHSWKSIIDELGRSDQLMILKKPFDDIEVIQLATALSEKRRLLEETRARMESLRERVGRQEHDLQVAHQDAEHLITSISSVLISLNIDGRVVRWNPAAEEVLNIAKSVAVGQRLDALDINWCDTKQIKSLYTNHGDNGRHAHIQFIDQFGKTRNLAMRIATVQQSDGVNYSLILADDITNQQLLKSQLDQAQRLEAVGQLAAGVAHEINTPMQYIGDNVRYIKKSLDTLDGFLELLPSIADESISDADVSKLRQKLTQTIPPRKIRSLLKQIPEALDDSIGGVQAVAKIVLAMKEFSHPGTDEFCNVDLNHVAESTVAVSKNEWKYVADVELELDDQLPAIQGLPSELNQAVLNMVVNAAHAIDGQVKSEVYKRGNIQISTGVEDGMAALRIRDNGGGIPANIRDRVFEPFFTTKDVGKGTGQGLAIVHSVIVGKHKGRLWIDVEDGVGTTFNLLIPFEKSEEADAAAATLVNGVTPDSIQPGVVA
ncbi:MAG: ATP-binding protein [Planctomycetota bacterium]